MMEAMMNQFGIADLVEVMPRLWAGINKPGGVARVEKFEYCTEDETYVYDVTYTVVGGRERHVMEKYVKQYIIERGTRSIKGRCRICGSFDSDCTCHMEQQTTDTMTATIVKSTNRKSLNSDNCKLYHESGCDDEESAVTISSDDESDDDYQVDEKRRAEEIPVSSSSATTESMPIIHAGLSTAQLLQNDLDSEYVRNLHKTLFDNCLQEINKDDNIIGIDRADLSATYNQALNEIKELSLVNLQDLIHRATSMIRNLMKKSNLDYDIRKILLSSVKAANHDEMEGLAQDIKIHESAYERRTRIIERVGFEVYRKCQKCFDKRIRNSSHVAKPERRRLKLYLENVDLTVLDQSQKWTDEIKRHRDGIDDLKDAFRIKFGQTVEQALHLEAPDDEEDGSVDDITLGQPRRKRKLALETTEAATPKLRDAAVEASTLRKMPYHEEYVASEPHYVPSSSSGRQQNNKSSSSSSENKLTAVSRQPQPSFKFDAIDNKRGSSSSSSKARLPSTVTVASFKRAPRGEAGFASLTVAVSKLSSYRNQHQYRQLDLSGYDDATNEQISTHDIITHHRQSFYHKIKKPVDLQATADGRVTILEDSSYALDTNNLSIPLCPRGHQGSSRRRIVSDNEDEDDVASSMFATLIAPKTSDTSTAAIQSLIEEGSDNVKATPFSTDQLVEYLHCKLESVLNPVEWQNASYVQWSGLVPQFITMLTYDLIAKLVVIQSDLHVVKASELRVSRLASSSSAKIASLVQAWQELQLSKAKLEMFVSQLVFEQTVLKPFLRSSSGVLEEMYPHIVLSITNKLNVSMKAIFDTKEKQTDDKYGRLAESLLDNIAVMKLKWVTSFINNLPSQPQAIETQLQTEIEQISHQTQSLLKQFLQNKVNLVDFQASLIISGNISQSFSDCAEVYILLLSLHVLDQYYIRWKQLFSSTSAQPKWLPCDVWQCIISALCSLGSNHQLQSGGSINKVYYTLYQLQREDALRALKPFMVKQESIWTVIMLATHHLISINSSSSRVRSNWPMVRLLLSPESLSNTSFATISNAFMKCADLSLLWDNCNEGLATFLHAVKAFVPIITNRFQLKVTSGNDEDIVKTLTKAKEMTLSNPKTLLILTTAFARYTQQQPYQQGSWLHARGNLHRNLLLIVSILLRSCNLPNPYEQYMGDFLHVDTGNAHHHSSSEDNNKEDVMMLIDTIRQAFKVLLLNITSELQGNTQELKTSVIHLKRATLFFKSNALLFNIFDEFPSFISGILQCMLVKEVEISLSSDLVRGDMNSIDKMMYSFVNKPLLVREGEVIVAENQQRSCLMFMTSLLIFNPFPIPSTRLTVTAVPVQQQEHEQKDLSTMNPFNSMIKLIQTMCQYSRQHNFNQLTDDIKQLLHAGLATSVAVLSHVDRCLIMNQSNADTPVVLAQQVVDETIDLLMILTCKVDKVDIVFVNAIALNTFAVLIQYVASFTGRLFTAKQAFTPPLEAVIVRLMNLWNSTVRSIFITTAKRCRIDYEHFSLSQQEFTRRLQTVPTMSKLDSMLANTNENSRFNFAITSSCVVSTMLTAIIDQVMVLQLREACIASTSVKPPVVGDMLSVQAYIKPIVSKLDTINNSNESNKNDSCESGYSSCFLKFVFWDRLLSSFLSMSEVHGISAVAALVQVIGSEAYLKDMFTVMAAVDLVGHSKARAVGSSQQNASRSLLIKLTSLLRLANSHAVVTAEVLAFAEQSPRQETNMSMVEFIIRNVLTNPFGVIARWGIINIILDTCFRAKRLLQNCLFQARKSHALIRNNLALLQRVCCVIQLAYLSSTPVIGAARVDSVAFASRFFNEFVIEDVAELLKQAAVLIRLSLQKTGDSAIDIAKQDLAEAMQDFLVYLTLYITLAYQQPFATRCKEWEVLLQPLTLFAHVRHARKFPRTVRDEMQSIWKASLGFIFQEAITVDDENEGKNSISKMRSEIRRLLPSFDYVNTKARLAQDQFKQYLSSHQAQEAWKQATIVVDKALYAEKDYSRERLSDAQVDETIQDAIRCFVVL